MTRVAASRLSGSGVRALFEESGGADELTIDLSVVKYFDLAALPILLASVVYRHRRRQTTLVALPNDSRALEFLDAWNFFECLSAWSGVEGDVLVKPEDLGQLRTVQREGGNRYRGELLPKYSLPLTRVSIDKERPLHAAARERDRWLDGPVQTVLERAIGGQASKYVGWAVFEGIKNTAMHSGAKLVYTTAEFQSSDRQDVHSEFAVCIWDDGESFAETLRQGLDRYKSIVTPAYGGLPQEFVVEVKERRKGPSTNFTLRARDGEPLGDHEVGQDLALTLAAFFLGVTSDPRPRTSVTLDLPTDAELADVLSRKGLSGLEEHGGIGTYLVLDTVVYECGGIVEYYQGPYQITFSSSGVPDRYHTKVEFATTGSGVEGNLIVLRLPGVKPSDFRGEKS